MKIADMTFQGKYIEMPQIAFASCVCLSPFASMQRVISKRSETSSAFAGPVTVRGLANVVDTASQNRRYDFSVTIH